MNQLEALDRLEQISKHIKEGRMAQAMIAAGMTDEHFPEGLSLDELAQTLHVRIADLAKAAGVKIK